MNTYQANRVRSGLLTDLHDHGGSLQRLRNLAKEQRWSSYTQERIHQVIHAERQRRLKAVTGKGTEE